MFRKNGSYTKIHLKTLFWQIQLCWSKALISNMANKAFLVLNLRILNFHEILPLRKFDVASNITIVFFSNASLEYPNGWILVLNLKFVSATFLLVSFLSLKKGLVKLG